MGPLQRDHTPGDWLLGVLSVLGDLLQFVVMFF